MRNQPTLSILICSCDKYADIWKPFFTLFHKYWPDCPYPIYLLTNHKVYDDSRIISLQTGEDRDWSSSFKTSIESIHSPYIMILMEDYLLTGKVDTPVIERLLSEIEKQNAGYFRLFPCPPPDLYKMELDGYPIGEISKGQSYRISLQAAIWSKELAIKIVRPGESAWEFETSGTARSNMLPDLFMGYMRKTGGGKLPFDYFCTAVVKGYWLKEAVAWCRQNDIEVDLKTRLAEPWLLRLKNRLLKIGLINRMYEQLLYFMRKRV